MRVILLSIAFLFLAFSAQSQVLKSAGVWYFLDVDSMTARPAVLPNGTELAYVVGTKTVYYWNRNTSTWTAYGSTFNRDSIYFDSSIIGSGTVSDPWGVDSTLFATIAGVGDSIAAALGYVAANFFPLQGGTLTGTGGNGFVGFPLQSSPPSTPATGFSLYAGSTGNNISWMQPDGFFRRLVSPVTGVARQYQFMARSYTLGDSADIANNVTSIAANYIATSNGTNLVARNLFDNNTYVGILNNKPFQLGQWTTAGRPSGVNGYAGFNTSFNWPEWYSSSGWFSPARAATAGGAFTAGYVPFGGSGGLTESANFTYSSGRLRVTSGSDYINFNPSNGSGRPEIQFFNSGNASILLSADFSGVEQTLYANSGLSITGALTVGSTLRAPGFQSNVNTGFPVQNGSLVLSPASGSRPFINFTEIAVAFKGNLGMTTGSPGDLFFETSPTNSNTPQSGTQRFRVNGSTGRFGIGAGSTINYSLEQLSQTDAFGVARGTVAQQPTIASSTTPIRFNTDSTALEYGESVGIWRQLATRNYARSLFSAVPVTNIYTANGTLPENRVLRGTDKRLSFYDLKFTPLLDSTRNVIALVSRIDTTLRRHGSDALNPDWGPIFEATIIGGNFGADTAVTQKGNIAGSIFIGTDRGYIEGGNNSFWDVVIGHNAKGLGNIPKRTALGAFAEAQGADAVAIGYDTRAKTNSIALGSSAKATGNQTIVIGAYSSTSVDSTGLWGYNLSTSSGLTIKKRQFYYGIGGGNTLGTQAHHIFFGKFSVGRDSAFNYNPRTGIFKLGTYGTPATTAAALSKTESGYVAGFATDGTMLGLEQKRDTTIYIDDADYDFSAALTTAQIASRFNRVIFWMTTTAAAGSDSELTLHTPDANLMQVEYLIHSVDEPAGFDNKIVFGTNNAVDSTNGLVTNYFPAAGDGIHIRAGLRSGVYKYRYSN